MKTKEEIEKCIDVCKRLRDVIPSHSMFGDDNHGKLDQQAALLEKCIGKTEDEVQELAEILCDIKASSDQLDAVDWVLGNVDDFVEESDVDTFSKK